MTALAIALTVVAGVAGAVQVAVMGRFGERIGTVEALAFGTTLTALIALAALLLARRSLAGYADGLRQPAWLWIGGVMGALVVFTITFATPKIGAFAQIGLFIAAQLVMGAVIDRFGLFGSARVGLSWARVCGIALLALGAALSLRKT